MKKKIDFMGYCKRGNSEWITVFRQDKPFNQYMNVTTSTKARFSKVQKHSIDVWFNLCGENWDFMITMKFEV